MLRLLLTVLGQQCLAMPAHEHCWRHPCLVCFLQEAARLECSILPNDQTADDVEMQINQTFKALLERTPELVEFLKDPGVCSPCICLEERGQALPDSLRQGGGGGRPGRLVQVLGREGRQAGEQPTTDLRGHILGLVLSSETNGLTRAARVLDPMQCWCCLLKFYGIS